MYEKEKDPFFKLKYIGYCMSSMPPKGVDYVIKDFINYCKFQLCHFTGTLFSDPIWDTYSNEDIVSEYYAWNYTKNSEEKDKFEAALIGVDSDWATWADREIAKNKIELEAKAEENEVSFSPDSIGEEE